MGGVLKQTKRVCLDFVPTLETPRTPEYAVQCFLLLKEYIHLLEYTAGTTRILQCDNLNNGIGTGNMFELTRMSMSSWSSTYWHIIWCRCNVDILIMVPVYK